MEPSNQPRRWVCVCRRHCDGQPRLLPESIFYSHLSDASDDEYSKIKATMGLSVDAARLLLSELAVVNRASLDPQAGPSTSCAVQRTATPQALVKRAREDQDGKRKCAHSKENNPPPERPPHDQKIPSPPERPHLPLYFPSSFPTGGEQRLPSLLLAQGLPERSPSFKFGYPGVNPFYMDYMRELHNAREQIEKLKIENAKLVTERDTLWDVLNRKNVIINPAPSGPSRITHPNIQFWRVDDFKKWLLTPEAQVTKRGKEAFLEEEDGNWVSDRRVSDIKASMRTAYCELVNKKCAPQSWGALDTTARQMFHSYMEKTYPLFKCAENGWKLDRLARTTYPAWRLLHLDENLNWKTKADKKKRRLKRKHAGEESSEPRKLYRADPDAIFNINQSVTSTASEPIVVTSEKITPGKPIVPAAPMAKTSSAATVVTQYKNPLNALADVTAKFDIEIPCNDAPSNTAPAPTPLANRIDAKKAVKMHPDKALNGRNLCARRWLVHFKNTSNGTNAEFKEYYDALSNEQRMAYDKEAADLVARNAWGTEAFQSPML